MSAENTDTLDPDLGETDLSLQHDSGEIDLSFQHGSGEIDLSFQHGSPEYYANMFCNPDKIHADYYVLKLYVPPEHTELIALYHDAIAKHNSQNDEELFHNSGFDLFVPHDEVFDTPLKTKMVDLGIRCEMIHNRYYMQADVEGNTDPSWWWSPCYTGYYLYPRSSMSKTPLMLSNHVGIIDAGYRGNIMAATRWLTLSPDEQPYTVAKHTRLYQICGPSLARLYVTLVDKEELTETTRGEGGFGSTGV
jgi:dUTP pyrophosphatase